MVKTLYIFKSFNWWHIHVKFRRAFHCQGCLIRPRMCLGSYFGCPSENLDFIYDHAAIKTHYIVLYPLYIIILCNFIDGITLETGGSAMSFEEMRTIKLEIITLHSYLLLELRLQQLGSWFEFIWENILRGILKAILSCIYYKYTIQWCEDLINYILKVVLWLHPITTRHT